MEHELQAAFEAAVASVHGGLSECSDDERLDVTLASPPSLEALNMAKEMQYAAAAAAAAGGARPQVNVSTPEMVLYVDSSSHSVEALYVSNEGSCDNQLFWGLNIMVSRRGS